MLPDIGVLDPRPARMVIRQVFLDHVIGGKKLSRGGRFRELVRAVTPDAVLDGVTALAAALAATDPDAGDVLVVDVGGATTDVYSALTNPGGYKGMGEGGCINVAPAIANAIIDAVAPIAEISVDETPIRPETIVEKLRAARERAG